MSPRVPMLALVAATTAGCLGAYDPDTSAADLGTARGDLAGPAADGAPVMLSSRERFEADVRPVMEARCAACHAFVGGAGPSFMKPDAYDSVLAYPGMITRDPTASLLVTKGPHNGAIYFNTAETLTIIGWLTVEADALPKGMNTSVATPPFAPSVGPNTIELSSLGATFNGAKVQFNASYVGSALQLADLTVTTDAMTGLHIVHPLFIVVRDGIKYPDPVDSFATLDAQIVKGKTVPLGPGLLVLNNVGRLDRLSIAFTRLEKYEGPGQMTGGCKAVSDFTMFAQPTLAQRCVSCHGGGNNTATNALDLRKVADTAMAAQVAACAQVRNRVNANDPASSSIFTVTRPGGQGHPFRFPDQNQFNAFVMSATQWITKEK